ncbi:MAG: ThuA domain-containing protein [Pirellulales bacterium]
MVWTAWLTVAVVLAARAASAAGPESWADKNLKAVKGLVAWYDASVENAARQAGNERQLLPGGAVDMWHDASGRGRHLVQTSSEAQPLYRVYDELSFVRFGGESTFLAAEGMELSLADVTIVLVAAPFSNDGGFRALLAASAKNTNDYVSGFTIDQGPQASHEFTTLNVEGAGFQGVDNLKPDETPFGRLRRVCVTSTVGAGGTALYLDGEPAGRRDRGDSTIRMDRLTVGARFYTNGGPPETRGFLTGEIAEVLIYDRVLGGDELGEVNRYLRTKYYGDSWAVPLPPELAAVRPVPKVPDPPPVQMFAPGFAVRLLPVDLPNINNVRYRPDGKLVAMGYDGHIHLLSDTDGDGLEDRADPFWDKPGLTNPIGIALTPPGYARGQGVFVASRGRLALVVDKDGDDRADELITVADGWTPIKPSVDALGVAVARDGNIYFGLGTQDYTNGHLVDKHGKAHYAPNLGRGAIMKVSPDFKHREQVCSGVRFTVALAFNRLGDLFCTDQEGATWLANGNPFDELLHIQTGRHYGFPPRHPEHLPDVIDEPSVYDYTPQHQSTCGLCFNEPQAGGRVFGPQWWMGNALVCGYSRGKLYRTTLVKTDHGYVADGAVLGCLNMLTVDACLSPLGELVVATHSGGPDWGSGPAGKGKLYKIAYDDAECPQPVRAWAGSPHEVHIAFDRPLDPESFQDFGERVMIEYGPYVRAGDRFESLWPGYSVVELQARGSRRLLPVLRTELTADRRAVVLTTGAHSQATSYAALLPDIRRARSESQSPNVLKQMPVVELSYNLCGVEAGWKPDEGDGGWSGWLPHLDVTAAKGLIAGSVQSRQLADACSRPGKLTLRTQLDLWQMLRPAVQPGSKLDYEPAAEGVTVVLESAGPIVVKSQSTEHHSRPTPDGGHRVAWTITPSAGAWQPIEVVVSTGKTGAVLRASWHTAEDGRGRAFAPRRFFVPWARPAIGAPSEESAAPPAELAGGDWHRGRDVFFGEKAQCGKCHSVGGKGGWIGPDLSNLVHRDYASVLRDITTPSFAINPEHLAYNVVLADGRVLTGMVQARGDLLSIGDIRGVETEVPRSIVEDLKPAMLSIMPEELPKAIGEQGMRDLLTFLLVAEPGGLEPAPIERAGAPPARTRAEVGAVVKNAQAIDSAKLEPLEIVLVWGPKDHGPGEHDYPAWQERWTRLFGRAAKVTVSRANPWPSSDQWKTADVVVMFSANPAWTPERAGDLDAFFQRGGGLVLLHYAVNGQRAPDELARRIGLAWNPEGSRYRHGELDLSFLTPKAHPITAGFSTLRFVDESYWNLVGDEKLVHVLATQVEEGRPRPMMWTFEPPGGRVFCSILGHYSWTFDDPMFRLLVLRAVAWVAGEPVDRFNELLLDGARVSGSPSAARSP